MLNSAANYPILDIWANKIPFPECASKLLIIAKSIAPAPKIYKNFILSAFNYRVNIVPIFPFTYCIKNVSFIAFYTPIKVPFDDKRYFGFKPNI